MNIIESIMTLNPCYTANKKITVKGLMLHSVGCNQPKASVFIKKWNKTTYKNKCVHGFIDANTGEVYQTLPWNHRGWHAGGTANNTHIGVEMCEPPNIKYTGKGANFTCDEPEKAIEYVKRTTKSAVELFAKLCTDYGLNPLAGGVIISHEEGCRKGLASNHADPSHLWKQLKMNYNMNTFRQDVANTMNNAQTNITNNTPNTNDPEPVPKKPYYTVQMSAHKDIALATIYGDRVKEAGFNVCILKIGDLYKVQVGEFDTRGAARDTLNKLDEAGYFGYITKRTV